MNGAAEQLAIPHGVTEKGIQITLMYSKSSQQVLFVEAGKDFVDLVVGFLTLPIGCVIKLLSESEWKLRAHDGMQIFQFSCWTVFYVFSNYFHQTVSLRLKKHRIVYDRYHNFVDYV